VRGTQSKYVPDEALPIIGQFFPRFELADVNAGHWLISEQPEAFRQGKSRILVSSSMILEVLTLPKAVVEFLRPKE